MSTPNGQSSSDPKPDQEGPSANGHAGNGVREHKDSFATRAIHVGSAPDPVTGAIIPGLHTATTYKQSGVGKPIVSEHWSIDLAHIADFAGWA